MTIKLNGSTAGSVALDAPASTTGNADIQFKLPVADGTASQVLKTDGSGNLAFTSLVTGVTDADHWYMHTNHSADASSNTLGVSGSSTIQRTNNISTISSGAPIGSGMSLDTSNGYFTFPSTGKYVVIVHGLILLYGSDSAGIETYVTANNGSNWYVHSYAQAHQSGGTLAHQVVSFALIDVTSTSNVKVRFDQDGLGTNSYIIGNASQDKTAFMFIRIGDT